MKLIPPVASKDYPGFFEIPGYSKYVISQEGLVIKKRTDSTPPCLVHGSQNPDGYVNHRIVPDGSVLKTVGRHRLMCIAFKQIEGNPEGTGLLVNHKNEIKGDDRKDNLEWMTTLQNIEAAGSSGGNPKCLPIMTRNVDTGEVKSYPSIKACADDNGFTKDLVNLHLQRGEEEVWPERLQYRMGHSNQPWNIPHDIEANIRNKTTSVAVLVRDVRTGEVSLFEQSKDAAVFTDVSQSVISTALRDPIRPLVNKFYQVKEASDLTPWREIGDVYTEYELTTGMKPVESFNPKTGERLVHWTSREAAHHFGVSPSTMHFWLNKSKGVVSRTGYIHSYYSEVLKVSMDRNVLGNLF